MLPHPSIVPPRLLTAPRVDGLLQAQAGWGEDPLQRGPCAFGGMDQPLQSLIAASPGQTLLNA